MARTLSRPLLDPRGGRRDWRPTARTEAAVLIPLHGWPDDPGLVFTERRHDLRRHAGEISFPGGRRDPGEELLETALREAEEEIGLAPRATSRSSARCRRSAPSSPATRSTPSSA